MNEEEFQVMVRRVRSALKDDTVCHWVGGDLYETLFRFGIEMPSITEMKDLIIALLRDTPDFSTIEGHICRSLFEAENRTGRTVGEMALGARREEDWRIYTFLKPVLCGDGKMIHYKCGDGSITSMVKSYRNARVVGYRSGDGWPEPPLDVDIRSFTLTTIDEANGPFAGGLMVDAMGDCSNRETAMATIDMMARVIIPGGSLVVLEAFPQDPTRVQVERTFMADYFWRRLFAGHNVLVRGNYTTASQLRDDFERAGFTYEERFPASSRKLGFGEACKLERTLLVFRRNRPA